MMKETAIDWITPSPENKLYISTLQNVRHFGQVIIRSLKGMYSCMAPASPIPTNRTQLRAIITVSVILRSR